MEYVYASIAACTAMIGGITDIRYGRVKNRHLLYAVACWLCALGIDFVIHGRVSAEFIPTLLNMVFSAALTAILYLKDIWAPGDGKLFLFIALVYPLSLSPCEDGNVFPALDIAIYAFAIGYVLLLISAIVRKSDANETSFVEDAKSIFQWQRIASIVSNIGLVASINMGLQSVCADFLAANRSLCSLCIIAIIYLINKKNQNLRRIVGYAGLCILFAIAVVDGTGPAMFAAIIQGMVSSVVIEMLNERMDKNCYRNIKGSEIKPGMILSHISVWNMQNCIDPNLPKTTTETRRSRLTLAQAQAVQLWCKNVRKDVTIVEMLPFAPCIAVATVIHIIRFIAFYR